MSKGCTNKTCRKKPLKKIKLPIIWVIGGPGAGKRTQSAFISAKYGFTHFSAIESLRNEVARKTPKGQKLEAIMERGDLVPIEFVLELIEEMMKKDPANRRGYIIDGFPADTGQGTQFERKFRPADLIIFLDASEEILMERATKSEQTMDVEDIKRMIDAFRKFKDPFLEQYAAKIKRINGEKTIEEVSAEIEVCMDALIVQTPQ